MGDPKPLASLSSSLLARKGAARPAMRRQVGLSPTAPHIGGHEDLGWNDMGYDVDPPKSAVPTAISDKAGSDKPGSDEAGAGEQQKTNPLAGAIPEVVKQQDALSRKLQDEVKAKADQSVTDKINIEAADIEAANIEADASETADPDGEAEKAQAPADPQTASPAAQSPKVSAPEAGRHIHAILSSKPGAAAPSLPTADECDDKSGVGESAQRASVPADEAEKSVLMRKQPKKAPGQTKPAASKSAAKGKRAAFTLRLDPERHLRLRLACAVQNQSAQQLVTEAVDKMLAGLPELDALAGQFPNKASTVK